MTFLMDPDVLLKLTLTGLVGCVTGLVGCVQVAILIQSAINKPRQYPLEFDHSYR